MKNLFYAITALYLACGGSMTQGQRTEDRLVGVERVLNLGCEDNLCVIREQLVPVNFDSCVLYIDVNNNGIYDASMPYNSDLGLFLAPFRGNSDPLSGITLVGYKCRDL